MSRSTMYGIIRDCETRGTSDRKPGSGGHNKVMTNTPLKKLVKAVNHKTGVSQRKLAAKFKVSQRTINKVLKKQQVIYFKRKRVPKVTPEQMPRQKVRLGKMRRDLHSNFDDDQIVLDDESYLALTGSGMPAKSGFYSSCKQNTPPSVKYNGTTKFPEAS
jgi:hypothetical protein